MLAPADTNDVVWEPLGRLVGAISGSARDHPELQWREGISVRLEWADERLWAIVEPRTVFSGITIDNKAAAADLARERTIKRYNRQLNDLISFWSNLLAGDGSDLRALGVGDGVDATFRLSADTCFSRRAWA